MTGWPSTTSVMIVPSGYLSMSRLHFVSAADPGHGHEVTEPGMPGSESPSLYGFAGCLANMRTLLPYHGFLIFQAAHPSTNASIASVPATALRTTCLRSPAMSIPAPMRAPRTRVYPTTPGSALQSPLTRVAALEPDGSAAGHIGHAAASPRAKPGAGRPARERDSTATGRSLCADLF